MSPRRQRTRLVYLSTCLLILELESWRQGCHRGCLINMFAWILKRSQPLSDRTWIHLIWLLAFLRLMFSNSCESKILKKIYLKSIYNIQQARLYIICNYWNLTLKKLYVWNSTQFSIFLENVQKHKSPLNRGMAYPRDRGAWDPWHRTKRLSVN